MQLDLKGNAVGLGTVEYREFIKRVDKVKSLIDRGVQRLLGKTYQRAGRVAKMYRPFQQMLAVSEGSFVITFKLAIAEKQQMSLFFDAAQVIDEIIIGAEYINNSDDESLQELLKEEGYYQHFVSMTRDIAPDGDKVNFVGLTSKRSSVSLTRQRNEIELKPKLEDLETQYEHLEISGVLDFAVSRKQDVIGLTTEEGKEYQILIAEGMDDLVKSYFGEWVIVTGPYDGKFIHPTDIQSS